MNLQPYSLLFRLVGRCWRSRSQCLQLAGCQVGVLASGLLGLGTVGVGIDYLHIYLVRRDHVRWPFGIAPPESWPPHLVIAGITGVIIASAVLRAALAWLSGVLSARLVHRVLIAGLQCDLFAKLQQLPSCFFDRNGSSKIINCATGDIAAIRSFTDTFLLQAFITALSLTTCLVYMLILHLGLTLASIVLLPLLVWFSHHHTRVVQPLYLKNRSLFDRMVLTITESIEGITVIKGFAQERAIAARFDSDNAMLTEHQQKLFRRVSLFAPSIEFLTHLSLIVLLLYGGFLVMQNQLSLGTGLVVFAGLLQQFAGHVTTLAQIASSAQEGLAAGRRVFDVLDAPSEIRMPAAPAKPPMLGTVEFVNATFRYGEQYRTAIEDLTLAVRPGECVAIVGETGSGKSTLLNLIPRFYDTTAGQVIVDGVDVRNWELNKLRRYVSIVPQDTFLFSGTIAENIAFSDPSARREEIERVARAASVDAFVSALPQGYDTVLGAEGARLSGGQRRQLAIARTLLANPSILLLDQPTASMDSATENELLSAIECTLRGRTTFIVTHHLRILRNATRILVLERGRIAQVGTHAELITRDGAYRTHVMRRSGPTEANHFVATDAHCRNAW